MNFFKPLVSFLVLAIAVPVVFAARTTKVACVGDSITFGYLIPTRETEAYPVVLGKLLGENYEVRNFGNPGKTAGDYPGQNGRWLGDNKEHKACVDFEADIVISNLGINDTGRWWDAKLFVEGYEKLIADWLGGKKPRKGVKYLMWTELAPDFRGPKDVKNYPGNIFKDFSFPPSDNGTAARHKEIHALLAKIAKKTNAFPLDAYKPLHNHPEMYLPDGLHPNAKGARRMAEFTFAALVKNKIIKYRAVAPKIVLNSNPQAVVLENPGKTAILLDNCGLTCGKAKFVFENATVLAPGESIMVSFSGSTDQKDPGSPLVCKEQKTDDAVFVLPKYK
ncbi:MAG: hypothetical protein K6B46_01340 [Opitutales bacterium]|nr:hypothetical protein [Opitutales bacterium]